MRRSCESLYQEQAWKDKEKGSEDKVDSLLAAIRIEESDFLSAFASLNFGAEKFDIYQPNMKPMCKLTRLLLHDYSKLCDQWFNHVIKNVERNKRKGPGFTMLLHSEAAEIGASSLLSDLLCNFRRKQEYHIQSLNLFQLLFNVSV